MTQNHLEITKISSLTRLHDVLLDGTITTDAVPAKVSRILPNVPDDRIAYWSDWVATRAVAEDRPAAWADAIDAADEDDSYTPEAA